MLLFKTKITVFYLYKRGSISAKNLLMLVEKDYIKELKYELLMFKDQVRKYGLLIRAFISLLRPGTAYRKLLFFVLMRDKNNQRVFSVCASVIHAFRLSFL